MSHQPRGIRPRKVRVQRYQPAWLTDLSLGQKTEWAWHVRLPHQVTLQHLGISVPGALCCCFTSALFPTMEYNGSFFPCNSKSIVGTINIYAFAGLFLTPPEGSVGVCVKLLYRTIEGSNVTGTCHWSNLAPRKQLIFLFHWDYLCVSEGVSRLWSCDNMNGRFQNVMLQLSFWNTLTFLHDETGALSTLHFCP